MLDSAPKDPGKYCVQITAKDTQYIGRCTKDVEIKKLNASVVVDNKVKKPSEPDPEFTYTWSGILSTEELKKGNPGDDPTTYDYYITRDPGEDEGVYAIKIILADPGVIIKNYNIEITNGTLTIRDKIEASIAVDKPSDITYGDDVPVFSITCSGLLPEDEGKMEEGVDYSFVYDYTNKDAGDHDVSVAPIEDGPISQKYLFTVSSSSLHVDKKEATIQCDNVQTVYGDSEKTLSAVGQGLCFSEELVSGQDYTISRAPGDADGEYAITAQVIPTGKIAKNYSFTSVNPGTYTIEKFADFENASFSSIADITYTGQTIVPQFTVSYVFPSGATKQFVEDTDFNVTYGDNKNAGTCSVIISGIGSCDTESSNSTSFEILRKNASLICDDKAVIYGQVPDYSISTTDIVSGEVLSQNDDYWINASSEDVGTCQINATINQDGPVSKNYNLTVKPGILTISVFTDFEHADVTPIKPLEYTGKEVCPDVFMSYTFGSEQNSVINNTKEFERDKDYFVTYRNNVNPGTATAILTGIEPNCTGSKTVNFEINAPIPGPDEPIYVNGDPATSDNILNTVVMICILI